MKSFLSRFGALVLFVVSGFDRLRLCGESRLLNHARGVQSYCYQRRILFKDFPAHAEILTKTLRDQTSQQRGDVPLKHLDSPDIDKEATALELARQHGLTTGRIALITCQESGLTYRLRKNANGLVEPRKEKTRCNHYYHYFQHEQLGLCYVRIQTWFPFTVRVGLIETTINSPKEYKVYRTKEGAASDAPKSWQQLRKGVADLPRRAEVADAANKRLAESLASVAEPNTLGDLLKPLGQPVVLERGRRARALNPLTGADGELLRALAQGDYLINGFRNRDLRSSLFGTCEDANERRRQSAKITRLLALLKAHGLILKVQKTHRYQLTAHGRRMATALLSAHTANTQQLSAVA